MNFQFIGNLVNKSVKSHQYLINQNPKFNDKSQRYIYIKLPEGLLELSVSKGIIHLFTPIEDHSNIIEMLIDECGELLYRMFSILSNSGVKIGTFDPNLSGYVPIDSDPKIIVSIVFDKSIKEYCINNNLFYFILIKHERN